jgi:hypothetical protein
MKNGLIFAFAVSICNAVAAAISCVLQGRAVDSILTIVPALIIYFLTTFIFFSFGAIVFGRWNPERRTFLVGVCCAVIQIVVAYLAYPHIGSVRQMTEFFVMPIVVCSFFAPFACRRK